MLQKGITNVETGNDQNVLKLDSGGGFTTLNTLKASELFTFKW